MIEMSQWPPPAGFSLLVLMTASCGLVAPIEPLPNADVGAGASAGASAGSGDGGTAGLGGAGSGIGGGGKGAAGGGGKGGSTAGRGGQAGNNGGQSGTATAGAGALGGAGQSGFGGSAAGAGNAGSDGTCEPEFEADITDQYDAEAPLPIVVPGSQLPTLLSRVDPIVVPLDGDRYRVFALSTGSEFVYADIPHSPSEPAPVEWTRIGTGQDYFSSPPAVAVFDGPGLTSDRMWVFGVGPDRLLRYAMQEGPFDGAWVPGGSEMELTDDGLFASAKATGNVLIGGRCIDHRACFAIRPAHAFDVPWRDFLFLPVESNFLPAAIETDNGMHVAVTGKDGIIRYAVGTLGLDSTWTEADFVWTELGGVCFKSGPTLVSGTTSIDVFARGTDGALYWQPLDGSGGWTKLSRPVVSSPLVIDEGQGNLLVFATAEGGQGVMRRRWGGLWTDWKIFADVGVALLDSTERPFPGAALPTGNSGVRLVARSPTSYLTEFSFANP
jgi:hypothetical protein